MRRALLLALAVVGMSAGHAMGQPPAGAPPGGRGGGRGGPAFVSPEVGADRHASRCAISRRTRSRSPPAASSTASRIR